MRIHPAPAGRTGESALAGPFAGPDNRMARFTRHWLLACDFLGGSAPKHPRLYRAVEAYLDVAELASRSPRVRAVKAGEVKLERVCLLLANEASPLFLLVVQDDLFE